MLTMTKESTGSDSEREGGRKEAAAERAAAPPARPGRGGSARRASGRVSNYVSILFTLMSTCTVFQLVSQQSVRRASKSERMTKEREEFASGSPPVDGEEEPPLRRVYYERTGKTSLSDAEMGDLLRAWGREWRRTGWDMKPRPPEERAKSTYEAEQDKDIMGVMHAHEGLRFWMYKN